MEMWEYKVEVVLTAGDVEKSAGNLRKTLGEAGVEGWELFDILETSGKTYTLIFKRRVEHHP